MSVQPFYDQLDGQAMDYRFKQPETMADLEAYSYFVAGSVGLMLLPVIAEENHKKLKAEATSLGIAMQLTNILRDIGEDYQQIDRIYLPEKLMEAENYSEQDLADQVVNESFIAIWERIARRAELLYESFFEALNDFDTDSQMQVALSAKVYRGIGCCGEK
ncbi:MAG: phytoene/squalene synthase family protein [Alkalibacterium sp.]|nr:phytoene/squalene synthase family protein [Alkalibacterium sp.]